jgi:hypothetical protein
MSPVEIIDGRRGEGLGLEPNHKIARRSFNTLYLKLSSVKLQVLRI